MDENLTINLLSSLPTKYNMIKSLFLVPMAISALLLASCSTGSMASKQDSMAASKVACAKCGKMGCAKCMKDDKMMGKKDAIMGKKDTMMDKKAAAKVRKATIMGN
jgi:hypothetical protein